MVAEQRIHAGQQELDLVLDRVGGPVRAGAALPITGSAMQHLWDALTAGYRALGFDTASDGDPVFASLVLARIIEPTSKLDSLRVLAEVGVPPPAYRTLTRRLPGYAADAFREALAAMCAAHVGLGPGVLVLYDVTTLYFETDAGDGFREPGFSKERRLEPQITVGLLTDAAGFPLMVQAFEGNRAETTTMLPTIRAFQAAHELTDVTVVADAGMLSQANQDAIEDAGLSFIIGARIPHVPYLVQQWRTEQPGQELPDGKVFTQPCAATTKERERGCGDKKFHYQYRADRARRTLRGIDEQVAKAEQAVAGKAAVKRNRFVTPSGGDRSVNRDLEAKARALAGLKGYVTNLSGASADTVISAYHQLWHIEKSFRMSKHDLQARPIYHHQRESIDAHLNIVFAALAVSRWIEHQTGWSIKKFARTARRYRTIQIKTGKHTPTAAPNGLTVTGFADQVRIMTGLNTRDYSTRHASCHLRKVRGNHLVEKPGRTRRYHVPPDAARTIAALLTLRDQVIAPIVAGVRSPRMGRKPITWTPVDRDYETLRIHLQTLFTHLGIATTQAVAA